MVHDQEDIEIILAAGPGKAAMVQGIYGRLVRLAAGHKREHRGWVLNRRLEPMGIPEIAIFLQFPADQVFAAIEILRLAKLAEWQNCTFAVEGGKPVSFGVSGDEVRGKERV